MRTTPEILFFTVSDARFFPGTVALLNSLRLTGNRGSLVVLDRGLSPEQRSLLASHADVVDLPPEARAAHPLLVKPPEHVLPPGTVVALIDSDMIVTGSLAEAGRLADEGKIFAYPDHHSALERRFAEWEELFELAAPPRHQTYMNAGLVLFSTEHWPDLVARWRRACARIPPERIMDGNPHQPFWAADQNALNALLMSEIPADALALGPAHEEVYWDALRQVRIEDERTLACTLGGRPVRILHYSHAPKAWAREAHSRIRSDDAFVRLLPRLLFADDVTVRLDPASAPLWLRPGRAGQAATAALGLANGLRGMIVRRDLSPVLRRLRPRRG